LCDWVRLQPPEFAEPAQVGTVESPDQVIDRMENRGRVRLDGHPVVLIEMVEPESGHDADQRGRGGLVAANLYLPPRTFVVRMVDHANREPQDTALNLVEAVEVSLRADFMVR